MSFNDKSLLNRILKKKLKVLFDFRFLIARHPFARIVSAYRNKIEDKERSHDGLYFFKTYSSKIIK